MTRFALVLSAITAASSAAIARPTVLAREGVRFTLNGKARFLLGCSYYGGLGAPEARLRTDLDAMQRSGMNWLRVWATWDAYGNDISAVDGQGEPRRVFMDRLKRLLAECDRRGMVVDVTLSRRASGPAPVLADLQTHTRGALAIADALAAHRNWYLDLANERDVRDARYVPVSELASMAKELHARYPHLLVTASGGSDVDATDAIRLVRAGMDFVCPHRPRGSGSPARTEAAARRLADALAQAGCPAPIHYQEPFRRGYGDWRPGTSDYLTDLRGAVAGGAAGWCFHNGSTRGAADEEPRRSFDLRRAGLFEQLDPAELAAVARMVSELGP